MRPTHFSAAARAAATSILLTFASTAVASPLVVTNEPDPNVLAETLVADDPSIQLVPNSATLVGSPAASGLFSGGTGILPFDSGVVFSSGNVQTLVGPNKSDSTSADLSAPGDAELDLIADAETFDAVSLEFKFITTGNRIQFQYVFGSEEYNEFVNQGVNDVFAFFLNGENIALIPGTSTPISIDTVNQSQNSEFFTDNVRDSNGNAPLNIELDGLVGERLALFATAEVTPGAENTLRLAIADGGDSILDSAVFVKANSIVPEPSGLGLLALGGLALTARRSCRRGTN